MNDYIKEHNHVIDIYKTVFLMDGIEEPFRNFGPDHPKIGDMVSPDIYFSDKFTYKLDKIYSKKITKDMMDEALAARWVCTSITHHYYHYDVTFKSLDKIAGKKRSVTYHDHYDLKCEIVDMPEEPRLIIDYKNGKYTLYELLKIFKEKKYYTRIYFKSVFLDMSGDEYLEVRDILEKEGIKVSELGPIDNEK